MSVAIYGRVLPGSLSRCRAAKHQEVAIGSTFGLKLVWQARQLVDRSQLRRPEVIQLAQVNEV
jgi:hypothetical protein